MAHKLGAVFVAAELDVVKHVSLITHIDPDLPYCRIKLDHMIGPSFRPQGRDEATVYIFHGTSLHGLVGILSARQIKALPFHGN